MPPEKTASYWQAATRSLARRVNFGWWLESWTGWLLGAALVGAVAILFVRWMPVVELRWVWCGIGAVLVLAAVLAWWLGRSRYETPQAARIRLEDALGLKTRLSAAEAGVGDWPTPPQEIKWPVQWRWQRPVTVLAVSGMVLLLAAWVPVAQREVDKKRIVQEPTAVKEVKEWMENLQKEEAVEEESVEEVEKKIAELLQRPAENWYEHGSLEAAGNLRDQTAEMLRELSQNLADAERAASALQAAGDALPQEAKDSLGNELGNAAQAMRTGGMKPNEQLLQQLQQMGGKGLGGMSKEQMQNLAKQLQKNAQALQDALKNSPELKLTECQGCNGSGKGKGRGKGKGKDGEGEGEDGPGRGGITRGPGTAPITLSSEETNLNSTKTEAVNSQIDMERVAPGDLLTVSDGKHEVDKNAYKGPQAGGTISNTGDGGAAVWQNSLLPSEREALKRYFK
ncbi:hypothetical protein DES53_11373 [Roseimicrobium gellanilyticum]|uniref:Uncharacterized protein n=1 Tax=Roseimicrobium gellanilyticum TaxID=748857 RepID=A0A366H8K0_9BACT|nr:hypothetical protein [Roseimicrobium gellanilyticum]RBP37691.1 hypothetical protein DES53_11373 [Roseimicrobium gellanilyticum]